MNLRPHPDCTYSSGDEVCFRQCHLSCVRNYRDQLDCDIPLQTQRSSEKSKRSNWRQSRTLTDRSTLS